MSNYVHPGIIVETEEIATRPPSSSAGLFCGVYGKTRRFRSDGDILRIPGDIGGVPQEAVIQNDNPVKESIEVLSVNGATTYILNTDYIIVEHKLPTKTTIGIERKAGGAIEANTDVQVRYSWFPEGFYNANLIRSASEAKRLYGPAFDNDNNLISELTLGLEAAFAGGASSVFACAVKPTYNQPESVNDYEAAFDKLWDTNQVIFMAVANGQDLITQNFKTKINSIVANGQDQLMGACGFGGGSKTTDEKITQAGIHKSSCVAQFDADYIQCYSDSQGTPVWVDGCFFACEKVGYAISHNPSEPFTRKPSNMFSDYMPKISQSEMDREAENGLNVVAKFSGGNIASRHDLVTLQNSNRYKNEWSYRSQVNNAISELKREVDSMNIIGTYFSKEALSLCVSICRVRLEVLRRTNQLRDYGGVKGYQDPKNLDNLIIEATIYPFNALNNITLKITVDSASALNVEVTQ